jgi:hypothetical protein
MSTRRKLSSRLEEVRRRFERWRGAHKAHRRIPDTLWALAVEVAGTYGIHRTSKALRLDYYSLKRHIGEQANDSDRMRADAAAAFVELAPCSGEGVATVPAGPCECVLELEDASGSKMRVHVKGMATPDLVMLSQSFWK